MSLPLSPPEASQIESSHCLIKCIAMCSLFRCIFFLLLSRCALFSLCSKRHSGIHHPQFSRTKQHATFSLTKYFWKRTVKKWQFYQTRAQNLVFQREDVSALAQLLEVSARCCRRNKRTSGMTCRISLWRDSAVRPLGEAGTRRSESSCFCLNAVGIPCLTMQGRMSIQHTGEIVTECCFFLRIVVKYGCRSKGVPKRWQKHLSGTNQNQPKQEVNHG